jgi:replicative DNA helicase
LKSGEFSPADSLQLARRACAEAPLLAMCDATRGYAPPRWMRDAALATKGDQPHLLVIVDSLHSWAESAPADAPEYETLNAGIVALRQLAHELNCPVLVVAERNRGAMSGGGLSAGAGTRKIEYGAETVLDMERDPTRREDAAGEVEITVKFAKNRHGAAGKKVLVFFHGALQKFRE